MAKPIISYALHVYAPGKAPRTFIIGARGWSARDGGRRLYLEGRFYGRDVSDACYSPIRAAEMLAGYAPKQVIYTLASDVKTRKMFRAFSAPVVR